MMIMNKMYVNFNFIHLNCNYCSKDLIPDIDLKQLAKQVILECKDLKDEQTTYLDYSFKCKNCQKFVSRKLMLEKIQSIYIVC